MRGWRAQLRRLRSVSRTEVLRVGSTRTTWRSGNGPRELDERIIESYAAKESLPVHVEPPDTHNFSTLGGVWNVLARLTVGRSVGILGPPRSGKTTLWGILTTGRLASEYVETAAYTDTPRASIRMPDGKVLHVRRSKDVAGEQDRVPATWKDVVGGSTHLVYLLDLSRVDDHEYQELLREQLHFVGTLLDEVRPSRRKKKAFTFVGSFSDKCGAGTGDRFFRSQLGEELQRIVRERELAAVRWQHGSQVSAGLAVDLVHNAIQKAV